MKKAHLLRWRPRIWTFLISLGIFPRPLAPWTAQLELDVVGVAEDQDTDPERLAEIPDLAVRDRVAIQHAHGIIEGGAGGHLEAHVVETDAVLVEAVGLDGALGLGM